MYQDSHKSVFLNGHAMELHSTRVERRGRSTTQTVILAETSRATIYSGRELILKRNNARVIRAAIQIGRPEDGAR